MLSSFPLETHTVNHTEYNFTDSLPRTRPNTIEAQASLDGIDLEMLSTLLHLQWMTPEDLLHSAAAMQLSE